LATLFPKKNGGADRDRTDDLLNAMYVKAHCRWLQIIADGDISRVFGLILIEEFAYGCRWLQIFTAQLLHSGKPLRSHGFRGFFCDPLIKRYRRRHLCNGNNLPNI